MKKAMQATKPGQGGTVPPKPKPTPTTSGKKLPPLSGGKKPSPPLSKGYPGGFAKGGMATVKARKR